MMSFKTHKLQVRVNDDELARLDRIVRWMNDPTDYEQRSKRRDLIKHDSYSWGMVSRSDVLRWLINSNQVDVLHARIQARTTKAIGKRTTKRRRPVKR